MLIFSWLSRARPSTSLDKSKSYLIVKLLYNLFLMIGQFYKECLMDSISKNACLGWAIMPEFD